MIRRIFIEKEIQNHPRVQHIIGHLKDIPITYISSVEQIFGRVRKPYLQKRIDTNLFIGTKKGKRLRESPKFYGLTEGPHYGIVNAYNCIYECVYCYLQGYFNSPDLVIYVNHQDFAQEVERVCRKMNCGERPWFHAGEYSDSLALSHLSGEVPLFFDLFRRFPEATLELRTKSVNISPLLSLPPLSNIITSFTLSPQTWIDMFEHRTPGLQARIQAMRRLIDRGHKVAVHLDPIIYRENLESAYAQMLKQLTRAVKPTSIEYISLGVVRFSERVFPQIQCNYPHSPLLSAQFVKSSDGKIKYNRPTRLYLLRKVRALCILAGIDPCRIYLCMEDR